MKKSDAVAVVSSYVGQGDSFHGDFQLTGALRVDGTVSGTVRSTSQVIIGPAGHIKTNVEAESVIVSGRVDGNIYALDFVHLLKNARVMGDIVAANLLVDEGVIFEGRAKINHLNVGG
ncbi:MAG: polymer-forming cytoskeletal protein [Leptospiraceae bacterium]|nr:polymer-forming cytoskeletal protein [Leptospiraceae bacterium]